MIVGKKIRELPNVVEALKSSSIYYSLSGILIDYIDQANGKSYSRIEFIQRNSSQKNR
jgi:hypothetical protein